MKNILYRLGLLAIAVLPLQSMQAQGLKDVYNDYFDVGVAVSLRNLGNAEQRELILREFNSITAENDMKPQSTHPAPDVWRWEGADSIANFCRRNGLKMRGHCLMWHNQIGEWMYKDKDGKLLSKKQFYKNMRQHIRTMVKRYKDVVYCWDVVNEAIADGGDNPFRNSPMYQIAGEEFIEMAFRYAHEADPKALLFYNDYNAADPRKRERIYNMVRAMKEKGVPIHGIGMQGHYNIHGPGMKDVEAAIERYARVVPNIHFTEIDMRANWEMGGSLEHSNKGVAISEEVKARHAQRYADLFRVLRKHRDVVRSATFWNVNDRHSWVGERNYPLLFDGQNHPKPAYERVKNFDARQDAVLRTLPLSDIRLSDPAILADTLTHMYYMTGTGGLMWNSADLRQWTGPYHVTDIDSTSWMGPRPMIWAAELHAYKGKYYYFATFTNTKKIIAEVRGNKIERRASQVLVADHPMGPYRLFGDATYLPDSVPTLDGTFWVEPDGTPYMVYCGEWLANWNGTMERIQLKPDLSGTVGQGEVLFRAFDSPWSRERDAEGNETPNKVTDGPYLFRTGSGRLGMVWTSWIYDVYTQGVAYSQSGTLAGPWIQEPDPITPPGYGHSMLFQNFNGQWLMSVHHHRSVNGRTIRIPHLFKVDLSGDKLVVGEEIR